MIKIQNNTATRDPLPAFLAGLAPESLADLSWTDPALDVQDCAWWPEVDQSVPLNEHERYGAETLVIDAENQRVIVTRAVVPWSVAEIEADRQARVPKEVSALAGLAAISEVPGLAAAYTAWAASPDRTFLERAFIDKAQTWKRSNQTLVDAVTSLGVTSEQLDAMFVRAKQLEQLL